MILNQPAAFVCACVCLCVFEGWNKVLAMFNCEADMWREDFFYMIADSWSMVDQYSAKSQLVSRNYTVS